MDRIVAWWGSPVEARSAVSRLSRDGFLTPRQVQSSLGRLEIIREQWREVQPTDRLRSIAEQLPDTYRLRALDAFQLAAALLWCNEKPKNRLFVCLDEKLSEAARLAGFTLLPETGTKPAK